MSLALKSRRKFAFLSIFCQNLPGVLPLLFVTRSRMLACDLVSSMLSRACILFFCSFSSNSILRKPAQYNIIDTTEKIEAKDGKLCFWEVILLWLLLESECTPSARLLCFSCYSIPRSQVWVSCQHYSAVYNICETSCLCFPIQRLGYWFFRVIIFHFSKIP